MKKFFAGAITMLIVISALALFGTKGWSMEEVGDEGSANGIYDVNFQIDVAGCKEALKEAKDRAWQKVRKS